MNHGNRPFSVLLPKAPDFGDAIILRGKLKPDAKKFSFNLCVDVCPCPEVVAFHFKTMLDSNTIVHNHKDITWQEETVSANTWVHGPGAEFTIQLVLTRDHVRVYDEQMLRYELEHKYDIQDAKTLQVWDDVEYISECTFKYGRPRN